MRFRNVSDQDVSFTDGTLKILVPKNKEIEFPEHFEGYCLPRRGEAPGQLLPSIVEMLCPQLKPIDPNEGVEKVEMKEKTIKSELKKTIPDYDTLVKSGMPPGVARAKVAAAQAAASVKDDEEEKDE